MTTPRHAQSRTGMTLVELLIVMTVLAILAGMILPVVINSFGTAREATVIFEMKQMELAIEQFKNDYGFYPPTIDSTTATGAEIQTIAQFRNYLNKISPQNAESSTSFPGSSNSRLQDWWTNVGSKLDETTSLQFWLSGLCKNKQFPLTGGVSGGTTGVMTLCGFGAARYSDGSEFPVGLVVERNNYYEFESLQLTAIAGGAVATYQQSFGASDGDLNFRYLDYKSFSFADGSPHAYCDGVDSSGNPLYLNPKKYQLVSYGKDGRPGGGGDVSDSGIDGADNMCNFAEGRLEKYLINR